MTNKEFNNKAQEHFDEMNTVGLGELLMFNDKIARIYIEKQTRYNTLLKTIVNICGYKTSSRDFAKKINYENFKKLPRISETAALGLKLFLLTQCGVDWENPDRRIILLPEE